MKNQHNEEDFLVRMEHAIFRFVLIILFILGVVPVICAKWHEAAKSIQEVTGHDQSSQTHEPTQQDAAKKTSNTSL